MGYLITFAVAFFLGWRECARHTHGTVVKGRR